jgi:hypothetical protein
MENFHWLFAMVIWTAASAVLGAGEFVPTDNEPVPARRMLERALAGPLADCRELVFAVRSIGSDGHYYANFGYYDNAPNKWAYGPGGGQLCKLDLRTGHVSVLLDDPQGGVRDPCVHYEGRKLVFSYRPGGTHHYHLFEIRTDGQGLRQLTDGPYDDIEPIYLPDDSLVFGSSRCNRWVACWYTQVAILYRCDPDGGTVRMLSSSIVHDNTPWMLPDGRLLYTRWEYVDRSRVRYHHLWTVRPDGTGQMVYFGNLHGGDVMIDAKPIPGTDQVACIFSPGHGQPEHAGRMTVVDPRGGPDCRPLARPLSSATDFRDPYPLDADSFLLTRGRQIVLMDSQGNTEVVYRLEHPDARLQVHEPRPLRSRPREPLLPETGDRQQATGQLILANVNQGRKMAGVRPGEVRRLLVLEQLPKPVNLNGTVDHNTSLGGTFTLKRILGTVPVEPDGSASFVVPALRSLFFVALDEHDLAVKRMQSFVTVQPGEVVSCVGCHEQRTETPRSRATGTLAALRRPPSDIEPVADVPDVLDFPRDIQPILERHCVRCHGGPAPDGKIDLSSAPSGHLVFMRSYYTLMTTPGLVAHGQDADGNRPARSIGSSASRLMATLEPTHYGVQLSATERRRIRLWIETGAAYPGTCAAMEVTASAYHVPDFRPNAHYVREMKRYGILPPDFDRGSPLDVYATDQAYWRQFWYRP